VIGNLSLVEFSSDFSFSSSFSLIVLASWAGCLLFGILLGLSLFAYNRVYISSCCSVLAFSFLYIENTKIYILHFGIFSFGLFVIDIDTCIERMHLIEIAELN
jgi:hypothetical protein